MKPILIKRYITALLVAAAFLAGGTAVAGDKRLTLTLVLVDTSETFEVKAPANSRLHSMKKKFMAEIGLSARDAKHYVLEKGSATTTTANVPYVRTIPTGDTGSDVTYETLDGDSSLKELGIENGDTLRLKRV